MRGAYEIRIKREVGNDHWSISLIQYIAGQRDKRALRMRRVIRCQAIPPQMERLRWHNGRIRDRKGTRPMQLKGQSLRQCSEALLNERDQVLEAPVNIHIRSGSRKMKRIVFEKGDWRDFEIS